MLVHIAQVYMNLLYIFNNLLQGDSSCFLFSLKPTMGVYQPTGYNDNYMYLNMGMQTMPNGLVSSCELSVVLLLFPRSLESNNGGCFESFWEYIQYSYPCSGRLARDTCVGPKCLMAPQKCKLALKNGNQMGNQTKT